MKSSGGKFLGEGSYGCVYNETPVGFKNKTNKLVKLLFSNKEFIIEVMKTSMANKMDKSITSPEIEDISYINYKDIKNSKMLSECSVHKKDRYKNIKKVYQIIYDSKYIGIDLFKLISKETFYLDRLFALSIKLYETLNIYNNYNFLHRDIKPDNIIYLKELDQIIFIDFGLSVSYNELLEDNDGRLNADYFFYPPEFKLIKSLYNGDDFDRFFNNFMKSLNKSQSHIEMSKILFNFYPNYKKDLQDMFIYYKTQYNKYNDIEKIINDDDFNKMDLYSLSISLYELLIIAIREYPHNIRNKEFIFDFLNQIIIPSINFDNKKRINVNECISRIKKLKVIDQDIKEIISRPSLLSLINNKTKTIKNRVKNIDSRCDKYTRKQFLEYAKELQIRNRHRMNKEELCNKVIDNM